MATLRRAAAVAVGVALGASVLALPAWAAQSTPAAVAGPVTSAKPNDLVPKDKQGNLVLYVDGQQAAKAVAEVGGTVAIGRDGRVEAKVPPAKVADLAKQPGVADIRRPDRIVPMGTIDPEGLSASGADRWIRAQKTGAGVKIGIIDPDLGGLADAQAGGTLPAQMPVNRGNCQADDPATTDHGTNVAEVVHATAPDAQLFVACAATSMEFATAANWLQQQGVQVITAALGMFTSGRGDGTGAQDSPADVVRRTSQAGILWSVAAGDQAETHWTGKAATNNGFVVFDGTAGVNNGFFASNGQRATVGLRWDAWPTTSQELDLYVMKANVPPTGPTDPNVLAYAVNNQATTQGGGEPTAEVSFTAPADQEYWVYVKNVNARPSTRLDLFVGGLSPSSVLQYYMKAGSVTEPATSPYALAVGATRPTSGEIEDNSSQGPTIDGRIKPDITGYDHVSTSYWPNGTFAGTSAAAAGVAGAAAQVKSANPKLDAAQVQAKLQASTNPVRSDNQWGSGQLVLGDPAASLDVTGSRYTALGKPVAIEGRGYAPNEVATLPIPNVPSDTTAVVFNLAVRTNPSAGPNVDSGLDVYTGDPATSTSRATTVRVSPSGGFVSTMVVVPVNHDRAIRLKAGAGNVFDNVDLLGYFSPTVGSGYVAEQQPVRVLDTRGFNNSPRKTALGAGETYAIPVRGVAGVPSAANAVLVNLTASESSGGTAMGMFATDSAGTTLNVNANEKRSNTSIVPIAPDGTIKVRNATGTVQATVDVIGSFASDPNAATFVPLSETTRLADTTTGTGERNGNLGQGETASFQLGGLAGISRAASGVVLRASGEEDSLGTDLSVFPQDAGWLNDTNATMRQREKMSATAFVPLGPSGKVGVRNERGNAQVALDVAGYFVGGPAFDAGNTDCAAPSNEAGYTSLYDGRSESNLIGWRAAGKALSDEGCALSTSEGAGTTWYAAHTFGQSYTVKLDYKQMQDGSNSDVWLGFPDPSADATVPSKIGVGVHIGYNSAADQSGTGSIVPFKPQTAAASKPAGQWNTVEIAVDWKTITVRLNGTVVNQYTVTDATRLYADAYLGLANASTGVWYRDVRVKRNQPIRVGQFVGVNSRCLDLYNGSPDSTGTTNGIQMFDCNPTSAQVWAQTADGAVTNAGKCLTALNNGTAAGTQEVLAPCVPQSSGQVWVIGDNGTIVNPRSGRCLTPSSTANQAVLQLQDCTGRADQVWRAPDQHGQNGELTDAGGKCLDVKNGDPRLNAVQVWDCYHNQSQSWIAPGDGSLHAEGKCLTVDKGLSAAGTAVLLWQCGAPTGGQEWVLRPDGTVLNPTSGRCLTGASDTNGATFTLQDCAGSALQQWRMSAQALWTGPIIGVGGKCADIKGENPANSTVWLWDCYGTAGEQWTTWGDGRLQAMASCIDIASVANGTAIGVTTCGSGSQQWAFRPDGAIVNTYSGRVLDDQSGATANGTKMQIWDFVGTPQQRWAIPLRPS